MFSLAGKKALVIGIANEDSIAYGCARAFREQGAELAIIRVNALSPGPLKTRAASGIGHFDELLNEAAARSPTHHLASIEDIGANAAFLASDQAANVTGGIHYIDGGYHIIG